VFDIAFNLQISSQILIPIKKRIFAKVPVRFTVLITDKLFISAMQSR